MGMLAWSSVCHVNLRFVECWPGEKGTRDGKDVGCGGISNEGSANVDGPGLLRMGDGIS